MPYLFAAVAAVVILGLAFITLRRLSSIHSASGRGEESFPFRKKDYLLSKAERSFYEVLLRSIGNDHVVFAKVRLLDLLWLPKGTANAQSHRNRVQSKHVDFVLCQRASLTPVLVVELDDASHEAPSRQHRDMLVDRVLASAGLPVLHVPAKPGYVQAELITQINQAIPAGIAARP